MSFYSFFSSINSSGLKIEASNNEDGSLKKVRARFSRSREINLTRWNNDIYLHLNDISKCFVDGRFDITKQKSISMKWEEVELLRTALAELVPHVQQMKTELVSRLFYMCLYLFYNLINHIEQLLNKSCCFIE